MLALSVMTSLAISSVPVFAPIAVGKIGVPPAYIGYFVSIIYVSGMAATLVSGSLIARFGAIRLSQASIFLCAAGLALMANATIPFLVLGAIAVGFGYGPITPASSHVLAKTTPKHLIGITFSVRQTGVPIGGLLAGALTPSLILLFGWQETTLILAAVCPLLIAFAQSVRAELDSDRHPDKFFSLGKITDPLKLVHGDPRLRELAWVSFLFCSVQMILTTYLVTYLTMNFNISLITAGLIFAATQFTSIVARVFWGYIADRLMPPRMVLGFLSIGMAAASIADGFTSNAWPIGLVIAVNAAFGATAIGWNGVFLAEVARIAPFGLAGAATGGALFFTYLGGILGPAIFGLIVSWTENYHYGFWIFGVVTLAAGVRILYTAQKT